MNKYEITIITKEPLDSARGKEKPVKKEIEALGGKILTVASLCQKQLVYAIKKETAGFYTSLNFEMEPTKVLQLNQKLGLAPEILRHIILLAKAAKVEVPKEVKIEKAPEKHLPALPAGPPKKTAEKIITPEPELPKVTKGVAKIEEEESSTEERLKALDKKLDEL